MAPATDPGGTATISRDGKSFFEILPRELRDRIYEYTFEQEVDTQDFVYQFAAPLPHLRLVSRQFKAEYDEQSPTNTTLVVVDKNPRTQCTFGTFHLREKVRHMSFPKLATKCTTLHFNQHLMDYPRNPANVVRARQCETAELMKCLPHLQRSHIVLSFILLENLDEIIHSHDFHKHLLRSHFVSADLDFKFELQYLGIELPPSRLFPEHVIQKAKPLKDPVILVVWRNQGRFKCGQTEYTARIVDRRRAEKDLVENDIAIWFNLPTTLY